MKKRFFLKLTTKNDVEMTLNVTEKNIKGLEEKGQIVMESETVLPESTIVIYKEGKEAKNVATNTKTDNPINNGSSK